jgi:transcriptional regulator of met regulon
VFFICFFFFSITNESLQKQEEELKRVSASLFLDVFSLLPDDDDHRRRRSRRHSTASCSITLNVQTLTFSTP